MRVWNMARPATISATVFLARCSRSNGCEIAPVSRSKLEHRVPGGKLGDGGS